MHPLPAGTVTFVFTDIEGSTRMLQELGDRYADVLLEHRRVLRDVWERNNGVVFGTEGDAVFVAFSMPTDAIRAAREAQRDLAGGPVRVRMGIHTGEPLIVANEYVGIDVHRVARIASAAHGGQVVVSERTCSFLADATDLEDLGLHRLKDLAAPERLFQLGSGAFPPLRSLNATNLPTQPSPLIGREREIAELTELAARHRIITLTGPGGTGKTRLALQVAAELVERFKDGTYWVPLAAITDPRLVVQTVGSAIGTDQPVDLHVGDKAVLVLLDNVEQVLACAADLATLVQRCRNLHLLVTSRAPLRIDGEREYQVGPLPDADAVELFRQRAVREDLPGHLISEICRRVDQLPLAVELAAARTRIFSLEQLLERLDQRLPLLTGGRRDAPERHRTLRATIAWSHDLLQPDEQVTFARVGVFAGSFDAETAGAVAGASIDALEGLVEHSLLRARAGRFSLLETVREYAGEQLDVMADHTTVRAKHARYFLDLAERGSKELEGQEAGAWIDRLSLAQDDLRAALAWMLHREAATDALRMCIALSAYWELRSNLEEALRWFEQALLVPGDVEPSLRALALRESGLLQMFSNRRADAIQQLEESVELWRTIGDQVGLSGSLRALGSAIGLDGNDHDRAQRILDEALALSSANFDRNGERRALHLLGELHRDQGDFDRAAALFERSIEIAAGLGAVLYVGGTMHSLADLELDRGDVERADQLYRESLRNAIKHHLYRHMVYCIAGLAAVAARENNEARAAILWRGAERAEQDLGFRMLEGERSRYERVVADIGPPEHTPSLEEAVAIALDLRTG